MGSIDDKFNRVCEELPQSVHPVGVLLPGIPLRPAFECGQEKLNEIESRLAVFFVLVREKVKTSAEVQLTRSVLPRWAKSGVGKLAENDHFVRVSRVKPSLP